MPTESTTPQLSASEVEMWRERAQSLIDWNNGVPGSYVTEGVFYISALLANMPPATILALCVAAQENAALREQLAQAENERDAALETLHGWTEAQAIANRKRVL